MVGLWSGDSHFQYLLITLNIPIMRSITGAVIIFLESHSPICSRRLKLKKKYHFNIWSRKTEERFWNGHSLSTAAWWKQTTTTCSLALNQRKKLSSPRDRSRATVVARGCQEGGNTLLTRSTCFALRSSFAFTIPWRENRQLWFEIVRWNVKASCKHLNTQEVVIGSAWVWTTHKIEPKRQLVLSQMSTN